MVVLLCAYQQEGSLCYAMLVPIILLLIFQLHSATFPMHELDFAAISPYFEKIELENYIDPLKRVPCGSSR